MTMEFVFIAISHIHAEHRLKTSWQHKQSGVRHIHLFNSYINIFQVIYKTAESSQDNE